MNPSSENGQAYFFYGMMRVTGLNKHLEHVRIRKGEESKKQVCRMDFLKSKEPISVVVVVQPDC